MYENWFRHYRDLLKPSTSGDPNVSRIAYHDANFSKSFETQRIAVHHVVLEPGYRSSAPHAESLEEEFVYVLKGQVHMWLDGYIYVMSPGMAAGFPSGTGISHCFINNSSEDVELLVLGEKTKPKNQCWFPLDLDAKAELGDFWWDFPQEKIFGPHKGMPGPVADNEWGQGKPECVIEAPPLAKLSGWYYPGDNETFGPGVRLTDKIGLKFLGVSYETLPEGKRSCWPHSHMVEEEFAYIVSGRAKVWMNGHAIEAGPGTGVFFKPGTNIAHVLINDSPEPLVYIGIGEAVDISPDQVFYPMHPTRNLNCRRNSYLWEARPAPEDFGPHNGRPQKFQQNRLSMELISEAAAPRVFELFKRSPGYFRKVDGCEPSLEIAKKAILDGPKNLSEGYYKEFLILKLDDREVGVVDLHRNHPENEIAYLGLLLITEDLFGKNWGRKFYDLVEDYVRRQMKCKKIRLGVSQANQVDGFWQKMGYAPNGHSYQWQGEKVSSPVTEFEKSV